ncbi:glycosyltransferase family 4 protein [Leptolyngbya iicbica]|uniref:Glycosyltransferase family 1 protein n=2 Tax=Cyanophyceae TaxID=3028117 RepID=A0A4Q7EGT9_9CYAN|nr:glycosyltransferase family 1 protein [Leptolyngbya sp. LK]RZM82831.1 glycosyltransferase family 1 protein [Leptolyngbya sp. LK]
MTVLVNLAYLLQRPTGTTNYALNLLPYLAELQPHYLATAASGLTDYHPVPDRMTAEYGMRGHLRRLLWTQFRLPAIYRQLATRSPSSPPLLFSPITEAPLFSRCRSVVMVHDLIPLRFSVSRAQTWLHRYYVPQVLRAAEHILCNSEATARDLTQFYGVSSSKITSILLAHDAQHFQPLGLERRNYFLLLGRQAPYKNGAIALQAFAQLTNARDYELWIAGPDDPRYTPDLKRQADELGITAQVKFLNYVSYDQLPGLLNQALALIFPSLWEGFGLPVLEAMACGTPVIASDRASIPEVTGDAALLVNPTDAGAIAHHMHCLTREPDLVRQLGQAGCDRAAQFSWQRTGEATVAVLQRFL